MITQDLQTPFGFVAAVTEQAEHFGQIENDQFNAVHERAYYPCI
ncbi:hypothetical protein [Pseudidiomarina halophila]